MAVRNALLQTTPAYSGGDDLRRRKRHHYRYGRASRAARAEISCTTMPEVVGEMTTTGSGTQLALSASPTFTGTVTIPTSFVLGATTVTTTGTQLNYLNTATGTTGTTSTNLVFSTSPVLTTPNIGAATATTINGLTITSSTSGTLTIANSSTLATSGANSLTLTTTGTTNATFPTGTITLADLGSTQTFSGTKTFSATNLFFTGTSFVTGNTASLNTNGAASGHTELGYYNCSFFSYSWCIFWHNGC